MEFCPLFSGSSGNATYVAAGGARILIDVGLPARTIEGAMAQNDLDPSAIDGILITHEHSDHIAGLGAFSRRYDVPVYANLKTWEAMYHKVGNIAPKNARVFDNERDFYIGHMAVRPFSTPHDSADSVGYSLMYKDKKFSYMTDIGHFPDRLMNEAKGSDLVFMESNHDVDMLRMGPYPSYLKRRILSARGHLSNADASDALVALIESGVRRIFLGHLSNENNTEEIARDTALRALMDHGIKPFEDAFIGIAKRSIPGQLAQL